MNNSQKFLSDFGKIENHLKEIIATERHQPFYHLVNDASRLSPTVRKFRTDLKEFADLRNAIIHESTDGHVIAEPNLEAVQTIHHISELILRPPKVIPLFLKKVTTFLKEAPLGQALEVMCKHSFSQAPVIDSGVCTGLLTTNTIARWTASFIQAQPPDPATLTIGDVLPFAERTEAFTFISEETEIVRALMAFQDFENNGKRLEALLITRSGDPSERIIGIMTISDIPKALKRLQTKR